ncbi:MAG: hypothetical protein IPL53_12735 [Ignavibacteria bacterium]|nr:hypothetical protein [Ignavibacteria bacterium]
MVKDSGLVKDPDDAFYNAYGYNIKQIKSVGLMNLREKNGSSPGYYSNKDSKVNYRKTVSKQKSRDEFYDCRSFQKFGNKGKSQW